MVKRYLLVVFLPYNYAVRQYAPQCRKTYNEEPTFPLPNPNHISRNQETNSKSQKASYRKQEPSNKKQMTNKTQIPNS